MASPISRSVTRFQRATVALLKIKQKADLAERYEPLLREFFRHYEHLLLFRLEAISQVREPTLADVNEVLSSIDVETTSTLQKLILHIERDSLMQGAKQAQDQFRPRMMAEVKAPDPVKTFTLENKRAVEYFRKTGGKTSYIKDIQKTTADQIKTLITSALKRGQSYTQISSDLRDLFDEQITPKRAKLIAVTETAAAYEAGNRAFAKSIEESGVKMQKMWMTSRDDKVSDGCQENMDDGWIPIDEAHSSGDMEPPRFPGCRCYEIYQEE